MVFIKYLEYREHRPQGTVEYPIAYYHITKQHPRYQMPCHWHDEYELIHIQKGCFSLTCDTHSYELKTGDSILISDGVLHGGIPVECEYECLVFDLNSLLKRCKPNTSWVYSFLSHQTRLLPLIPRDTCYAQIINLMLPAASKKAAGCEYIVLGCIYELFGLLIDQKHYETITMDSNQNYDRLELFKRVLQYIEDNYSDPLTLPQLADIGGMNPNYFCRYFKQLTQKTPICYLTYYRIECAREALATTNASITEIALNCGFHDVSYFIRIFKKLTGVTPNKFRSQDSSYR